MIALGKYCI